MREPTSTEKLNTIIKDIHKQCEHLFHNVNVSYYTFSPLSYIIILFRDDNNNNNNLINEEWIYKDVFPFLYSFGIPLWFDDLRIKIHLVNENEIDYCLNEIMNQQGQVDRYIKLDMSPDYIFGSIKREQVPDFILILQKVKDKMINGFILK